MFASGNNEILRKGQLSSLVVIMFRVLIFLFLNLAYFICFYFSLHDNV
jgi:hypothetical protein